MEEFEAIEYTLRKHDGRVFLVFVLCESKVKISE